MNRREAFKAAASAVLALVGVKQPPPTLLGLPVVEMQAADLVCKVTVPNYLLFNTGSITPNELRTMLGVAPYHCQADEILGLLGLKVVPFECDS